MLVAAEQLVAHILCPIQITSFGQGLQARHIICYIAIIFGFETSRYDGYKLSKIEPDNNCNITNATWDAIQVEATNYRAGVLLKSYITVRTD